MLFFVVDKTPCPKATYGEKVYFLLVVLERVHNGRCGIVAGPASRSGALTSSATCRKQRRKKLQWNGANAFSAFPE